MKGKIKKEHIAQFNPVFVTVIDGKTAKVTLKEAEENAEKYIKTPMGVLYEDYAKLLEEVNNRTPKVKAEVIDMSKVRRGTAFDPDNNPNKKAIEAFKERQEMALYKIAKRKNLPVSEVKVVEKETKAKTKKAK